MSELPVDFDVDYELTRFFRRARRYSMGRLGEIHPELDYNNLILLLAICDSTEGVRASQLAHDLKVHKSTVSRAVSTLEGLGLVIRTTHPDDGRAQLLTVPPEVRESVDAFRLRGHAWLVGLFAEWDQAELASFARQLARLNDAAGNDPD